MVRRAVRAAVEYTQSIEEQRDRMGKALLDIVDTEAHDYGLIPLRVLSIVRTALEAKDE